MEEQPSGMNYPAVFVIAWACEVDGCERLASSLRYLSVPDPCHVRDQTAVRATVKMH